MNPTDAIGSMSNRKVTEAAFAVLDAFQYKPPSEQVMGAGLMLIIWCYRFNIDPRDVLVSCQRRFKDALAQQEAGNQQHVHAIKLFMKNDVDAPAAFNF